MFQRIKKLIDRFKNAVKRPLDDDDREALYELGTVFFFAAKDGISQEEWDYIDEAIKNLRKARRNTP